MADTSLPETGAPGNEPSTSRDAKVKKYLDQFDTMILGVTGAALVLTFFYGLTAGPGLSRPASERPAAEVQQPRRPPAPLAKTESPAAPAGNTAPRNVVAGNNVESSATNPARTPPARPAAEGPARPTSLCPGTCGDIGAHTATSLLALAIAMAALALGAFVGFLFGLPRTLTSGEARDEARSNEILAAANENSEGVQTSRIASRSSSGVSAGVGVNTNLEQISDWLTKIIVGVGLTKLETIPGALDRFGNNVDPYFSFGGKVFGIGAGLFFLIVGFFLAYVGTRVKLSLVFVGSQRDNTDTAARQETAEVALSAGTSAVDTSSLANQQSPDLKKADEQILERSLTELKTPEERIAYANAAAREGRREVAIEIMAELARERPTDGTILANYAGVLALLGDVRVDDVLSTIRTTAPAAEQSAQDKVNIAILRNGLYDGSYEASIDAGEALLTQPIAERDPWIHIWLACAYGQKHAELKAAPTPPAEELATLRDNAVAEIRRAVTLDPALKSFVLTLYDPTVSNGQDNDLQTFHQDAEIETLLRG